MGPTSFFFPSHAAGNFFGHAGSVVQASNM